MSDIQTRLADINQRAAASQVKRDREFVALLGFHLLVLIAAAFFFGSIPRLIHAEKIAALECQEACVSWGK
jgi:hypothetical protein